MHREVVCWILAFDSHEEAGEGVREAAGKATIVLKQQSTSLIYFCFMRVFRHSEELC